MSGKTIGELADALREIYLRKQEKVNELKAIQDEYDAAETSLMEAAESQQTTTGKGKIASFSIGESVVPHVKDWDAFYKYIGKMKYYHLLERRPSVSGCRELFDTKGAIPGIEKFTKRKVNLRGV